MKTIVTEIVEETADVRTLRLVRADGTPFAPYEPGAHVDVTGPTGLVRQYSLCGPPGDTTSRLIAVKREPNSRGGSKALHTVEVGDHLEIGEPRSLLALADTADRHVLVAGGIGVTPLLSMAYALRDQDAGYELHHFTSSDAPFADLLAAEFHAHLHTGVPRTEHPALLAGIPVTQASHVYTCGPRGFMDQVTSVFAPTVAQVHVEHFVATEIDTSADTPFMVELDTGEVFEIPAGRSIVSVLTENGIEVFTSCEEGICGSCVSGVLDGTPDHRDNCLTAADRASQMALCVSRARSEKLVIELY